MVKYSQGKIYKITSPSTPKIYIGSTTDQLCRRMTGHRGDGRRRLNTPGGSYEILKYNDAVITLIKYAPCETKEELLKIERECIEEHALRGIILVNKFSPINTPGESSAKGQLKNKEKHTCECGGKYTYGNKLQHFRMKKHLQYMENKPATINSLIKNESVAPLPVLLDEKNKCVCGGYTIKRHLQQHLRTKKHANYLTNAHTPAHAT